MVCRLGVEERPVKGLVFSQKATSRKSISKWNGAVKESLDNGAQYLRGEQLQLLW